MTERYIRATCPLCCHQWTVLARVVVENRDRELPVGFVVPGQRLFVFLWSCPACGMLVTEHGGELDGMRYVVALESPPGGRRSCPRCMSADGATPTQPRDCQP